ncbi:site-specific DNA-methyltransferase [Nubsella zeaxanthinifaciens]|uniref:site-specific DNA-methyltransferase n=1 Tax=Nubsella zeaxanthinifaciens TaxID=392412 RepID=UPI000DE33CC5|nr:site-specific DNA-methyltransferase [Nubsella zeaxanthinifaciens]
MIQDILAQNENRNVNDKQLVALREHFPSCFKSDGSFDIEKFKTEISEKTDVVNEGYELKFLGKSYAKLMASTDTTTVIQPNTEHNNLPENANSQNIYISGDNLDGLKHLLKSYSKSIKCIYIDPPYNTGSDGFVYQDNFNYTLENLQEKLSISEDEAQRILDLTRRGSSSHSAWLMFMYCRLLLARDVLTDDGVIFISIDDNEQANLKLLCDDVFGEENFVGDLVWEKKKKGTFLSNSLTNIKESILTFSKNKIEFNGLIAEIKTDIETYPCINSSNKRENRIIRKGTKSKYREPNFYLKAGSEISDTTMSIVLHTDLKIENQILVDDVVIEGNWRYTQENMDLFSKDSNIYITQDLYVRRIVDEPRSKTLKDLLLREGKNRELKYANFNIDNLHEDGWGSNEDAEEELRLLMSKIGIFSNPKPSKLIKKLVASVRDENSVVLDFFSGSATTAHAVMQLNAEDGGNRKFISLQLPEVISANNPSQKAAFDFLTEQGLPKTLDYIGIERIKRAAAKIKEVQEKKRKATEADLFKEESTTELDLGFKHFTLVEPNQNTLDKLDSFDKVALLADTTILEDFGKPTILATWLNADGYGLSAPAESIGLADYTAYYCQKHLYLIDPNFTLDSMKALLSKYDSEGSFNPENLVLFGYSFPDWSISEMVDKNLRILNDSEKNLKINFHVRY